MAGDKKEPNRGDLRLLAPLSACATQSELPSRELPWPMPVLLAYRRQSGSPTPLSRKPTFFNSLLGANLVRLLRKAVGFVVEHNVFDNAVLLLMASTIS